MDKRTATYTVRERRGQRRNSASPPTRLMAVAAILFAIGMVPSAADPERIAVTDAGDGALTVFQDATPDEGRTLELGGDPHYTGASSNSRGT